jgi:hypothetical protein
MNLTVYLDRVSGALASKDGKTLADLVSVCNPKEQLDLKTHACGQIEQIANVKLGRFNTIGEVMVGLLKARKNLELNELGEAYICQIGAVV